MKIAITGKGGVGKTTLAAALALKLSEQGRRVLAVDADPDTNLAAALGVSRDVQQSIVPVSKLRALVEERTGAKVREYGQIFKLNPEVSDIAEKYAISHKGVSLLVLGAVESGGSGCACPENVLLRALVTDIVLNKSDAVVLDMEAGIEHLGRATAKSVDTMVVVVEPGQRSVDSALRINEMAAQIGIGSIKVVANKVSSKEDEDFVEQAIDGLELIGSIPFSPVFQAADRAGRNVLDGVGGEIAERYAKILEKLDKSI